MANRTETDKPRRVRTPYQKARFWATVTIFATLAFSVFSNVRSGLLSAEPAVYAVAPVVILFLLVHLIGHYNPKSNFQKGLAYGGLVLSALFAFGMSGWHIAHEAHRNGQPWIIAAPYPFIVDFPSVIGMLILAKKSASVSNGTKTGETEIPPQPAKTTPARANGAPKTQPAKTTKPPAKKATPAKSTKPSQTVPKLDPLDDPLERAMLNA